MVTRDVFQLELEKRNVVQSEVDSVTGGIEKLLASGVDIYQPASGHAQRLIGKLRTQSADSTLLVVSDSTGVGTDRWVYRLGQWIAPRYPAITVNYRAWNDTNGNYDAAITIQTGTGSKTLTIYNAAVSGTRPDHFLGSRYATAITALTNVDLLIVNHGHNLAGDLTQDHIGMHYLELTEPVLLTHPGAGVILIAQNPEMETTDNDTRAAAARDIAAVRGFGVADVWQEFTDRGKAASLYVTTDTPGDTKHPSSGVGTSGAPTGTDIFTACIAQHFVGRQVAPEAPVSLISQVAGQNLLLNGDFATWTTTPGAPDSWTSANCTVTKDTTIKFGLNQYSAKLVGNGAGQPYLQQDFSVAYRDASRGRWMCLAVATYTDANAACLPSLTSTSNAGNTYTPTNDGLGGWRWKFLPVQIGAADSYVRCRLYAETGQNNGLIGYFGGVKLVFGKLPSA